MKHLFFCGLLLVAVGFPCAPAEADVRAFPKGESPGDARLGPPMTVDSYHPLRTVESLAEWKVRKEAIQRRIQIASGLWPMPEKTPLNARVFDRRELDGYSIEKVILESLPGHFVTGSLYRPIGESLEIGLEDGKRPGVLCPHGHWKDARFYDAGEDSALKQIAEGGERFISGGRNPIQARCVQLARMGCVVLLYDMIGYSDSLQLEEHRRGPRESMNSTEKGEWGFVSPRAAGWLQTNFGLQTWNSVRALDFIDAMEEVDTDRLLVTGASGGGTQTMILAAIDDRVDAAFPCVMPSTAMQGGCTCENTHLLRIGQGNMDIAAATAPRPQGMTAADDWTIELETKGYPDLVEIYRLEKARENVEGHFNIQFRHNYNHVSRTQMYQFVNEHFELGLPSPVLEREFQLQTREDLTVWGEDFPLPTGDGAGDAHERAICAWWTEDAEAQIQPLLAPESEEELKTAREIIGGAVRTLIAEGLPEVVSFDLREKQKKDDFLLMSGVVSDEEAGTEIPVLFAHPQDWNGSVVIQIFPEGKQGLLQGDGLAPMTEKLVAAGVSVMSADLFGQGEFLMEEQSFEENTRVAYKGSTEGNAWKLSPVYYYGYNHSIFARRAHDILSCLQFVQTHPQWEAEKVSLVGLEGAGHWVAAARAVAGDSVDHAVAVTKGFRFADLESDWDADFLPGALKYGDVAGFLTRSEPSSLTVVDANEELQSQLQATWKASGSADRLTLLSSTDEDLILESLTQP